MQRVLVCVLLVGALISASSAHAALSSGKVSATESGFEARSALKSAGGVEFAGYWGYAQCVAERRAWQGQHGMTGWSMLTPVMIGTAASCFEAFY